MNCCEIWALLARFWKTSQISFADAQKSKSAAHGKAQRSWRRLGAGDGLVAALGVLAALRSACRGSLQSSCRACGVAGPGAPGSGDAGRSGAWLPFSDDLLGILATAISEIQIMKTWLKYLGDGNF